MKYRKLLEQYQKNLLDEGKKKQIEEDIEKHEAISEYLYTKEEEVEGFSTEKDEICRLRRCCVKKVYKNPYFTPLNGQNDKETPKNAQI